MRARGVNYYGGPQVTPPVTSALGAGTGAIRALAVGPGPDGRWHYRRSLASRVILLTTIGSTLAMIGPALVARRDAAAREPDALAILDREKEDLSRLLSREEGKTFKEAMGEVQRSLNILEYTAAEGRRSGFLDTINKPLSKLFSR